ncbi:hypothetical protein AKJ08_3225 [Vulgatibacter incomptus]|uniref:Uncharacterized protein n=2 Tax=Vulgatibacter incomptus TaxID=1391653 RepID=A0A0K1PH25_9BACT|nr:hypothetical protein AKJ08_3225 [Vulgatibacter incomptus]
MLMLALLAAVACGEGGSELADGDFEWPDCPEWYGFGDKPQCYIDRYERGFWDGKCWQPPDRLFKRITARDEHGKTICLPRPDSIPEAGVNPSAGYFCTTDFSGRGHAEIEDRAKMWCAQQPHDCPCGPDAVIPRICFAPRFVADADGSNEQLEWLFVFDEVCT